jgi:hypothetical protein
MRCRGTLNYVAPFCVFSLASWGSNVDWCGYSSSLKSLRGLLKRHGLSGEKDGGGFILVSSAGGDKRRPRRRALCTFGHELASIHFADPDLDSLFASRELRERLRIVIAVVVGEDDLRPHCFHRINEHLVIHCVELGSKARIVNR